MFKWFKNKKNKQDVISKDSEVLLHGHSLNEWMYLGYTTITLNEYECCIFMFVSLSDIKKRSYTLKSYNLDKFKKYHSFIPKFVEPWAAGDGEIWRLVTSPSSDFRNWMLDHYGVFWNFDKKWWDTNEQTKYHSAKKKEELKKTSTSNSVSEDNIIQVNFEKKNED